MHQERNKRESLKQIYEKWAAADRDERTEWEDLLRRLWPRAWGSKTIKDRVRALSFVSQLPVEEGQDIIWSALESPLAELRDKAAEAAVMYFARVNKPPTTSAVTSLWSYLLNTTNRRRILAFLTLDRLQ